MTNQKINKHEYYQTRWQKHYGQFPLHEGWQFVGKASPELMEQAAQKWADYMVVMEQLHRETGSGVFDHLHIDVEC